VAGGHLIQRAQRHHPSFEPPAGAASSSPRTVSPDQPLKDRDMARLYYHSVAMQLE